MVGATVGGHALQSTGHAPARPNATSVHRFAANDKQNTPSGEPLQVPDGDLDGDTVGTLVGFLVGTAVGLLVIGMAVGPAVGVLVLGEAVGDVVGTGVVGSSVGASVGLEVVGDSVGATVGAHALQSTGHVTRSCALSAHDAAAVVLNGLQVKLSSGTP